MNASTPQSIKKEQEKVQDEFISKVDSNADRPVELVMSSKRPSIKVPLQVAIRKEVQISDLPAVWLFAFGNLSVEEYNRYLTEHKEDLTINELTASRVLEGVLQGRTEDKQIYWRLQEKILSKPTSVNQRNGMADVRPNAIMKSLLDEIEKNVFKEVKEGEVLDNASPEEYTDNN